jgi:hypothetical protein
MEINNDVISPDEKVCNNCQHLAWLIGVGQGLRCSHPKKINGDNSIPSRRHTCDLYRPKDILGEPEKTS